MPKKLSKSKSKSKSNTKNSLLFFCSCVSAIIVLVLSGINLNNFLSKSSVLGTGTEASEDSPLSEYEKEKAFWKDFLAKNPSYIDGWIELYKLEAQNGNYQEAQIALGKARQIGPNSEKLLNLK